MRKLLVLFVFAIVIAVAAYTGIGADSYFLIRIGDWAMQMTLLVAGLLALFAIAVLRIFWGVFRGVFLGAWPAAWRSRRQQGLTREAMEDLALSDWAAAQKVLVRLANQSQSPAPLVVLSAHTAELQGDYQEATKVYKRAAQEFPSWSHVVDLRLCGIAISEGRFEEADEILSKVPSSKKDQSQLILLRARLEEERGAWSALQATLLDARKKPLLRAQLAPIERRYVSNRLAEKPSSPDLLSLYEYVNASENSSATVVAQLAQQLAMRGHGKEAEVVVRKTLENQWNDSLMAIYAELEAQSPKKQLKVAESWLASHQESDALLEGLYRLAVRADDDDKSDLYAKKLSERAGASSSRLPELASG